MSLGSDHSMRRARAQAAVRVLCDRRKAWGPERSDGHTAQTQGSRRRPFAAPFRESTHTSSSDYGFSFPVTWIQVEGAKSHRRNPECADRRKGVFPPESVNRYVAF